MEGKTASLLVTSTFSAQFYAGTNKTIEAQIDLNLLSGISQFEFYDLEENQKIIVDNSSLSTETIYFVARPQNADLKNFSLTSTENIVCGELRRVENKDELLGANRDLYADADILALDITSKGAKTQENAKVFVSYKNGLSLEANVSLVLPLNESEIYIEVENKQSNQAIAHISTTTLGSEFFVALANGNTASLDFSHKENVSFKFMSMLSSFTI